MSIKDWCEFLKGKAALFTVVIIFIGLVIIYIFGIEIHWKTSPWRITRMVDSEKYREYCPDPEAIGKYGFCIWVETNNRKEADLLYSEAAEICKQKGGRLCSLAEVYASHAAGANWCYWGWVADQVPNKMLTQAYTVVAVQNVSPQCAGKDALFQMRAADKIKSRQRAYCCR